MSSCLYEVVDLHKGYSNGTKNVEVLRGVDFRVKAGESVAITGPSGVGKSTFLHILGLLDRPVSGSVLMDGVDVCAMDDTQRAKLRNKRIGFVFQFFQLLPEFTATENVMMPGLIAGNKKGPLKTRALELLSEVGLADRVSHRPGELSGGEQQRVAIARALIMEPDALLADEPTGNLDPDTGFEVEELLKRLNKTLNTTLVIVTHRESLSTTLDRHVGLIGGKLKELR